MAAKELRRKLRTRYFRDGDLTPRAFFHALGELFYFAGFHTEYFLRRLGRLVRRGVHGFAGGIVWLLHLAGSILRPLGATILEDLSAPWVQLRQGFRNLRTMLRQEREAGGGNVAGKGWRYLLNGIHAYRDLAWNALSYLLPLAAGAVFVLVVHTVLNYQFALRVEYRGEIVGFIESETVYEEAKAIVNERVRGSGENVRLMDDAALSLTLSVVDRAALSGKSVLADDLVAMSPEKFQNALGVWVNDVLVGATTEMPVVQAAYNGPLAGNGEGDATVSYRQDVRLQPGLYFTDTLISGEELVARLTGQAPFTLPSGEDLQWNILAETQTTVRQTYTEAYSLERQVIERDDLPWGEEAVLVAGQDGQRTVVADVVYVDGTEVQRTVISETILTEPVQEVVEYGTLNQYGGVAGEPGDGQFIWPVPNCTGQSRGYITYGSYVAHRGLDITAKYGTPILAADNGLVEFSGAGTGGNWSYGNFVKIDHGNGYTTLYGHMAAVAVESGQYVGKGEVIGYVGSTGRSTGNHCHFEITKNGKLQNPAGYVARP